MSNHPLNVTAPGDVYRTRRALLASKLEQPVVLFAGEPRARNYATNTHPFRAASNYLYFGGPPIAGAALLIEPDSDGDSGCTLARNVFGFDTIVWIGSSPSDEFLASAAGLHESALIEPDDLTAKFRGLDAVFLAPPCPPTHEWIARLKLQPAGPDVMAAIVDQRLCKDEHELEAMRFAARIGVEAHRAAIKAAKPGQSEAAVAAAHLGVLAANRCAPSFSALASVHGEVLHPEGYPGTLESGRLLLIDAGAEEPGGYASDITRTLPVSGTFTPIQRQLHDTVYRAEQTAIEACLPGRRFRDLHDLAARVICEGLVEADLLRGDPADLVARAAHTLFFCHGLGHLIGLDVHDMEEFGDLAGYATGRTRRTEFGNKYLRLDRDLATGMTLTIEPGIYLVPAIWHNDALVAPFADVINRPAVDRLLDDGFGGIRIEETVCVQSTSASGPEVLSIALPGDADGMIELMASA